MRVLLVEDDEALSQAVCGYLRAKAFVVDAVPSLAQAGAALHAAQYAAVLLDLHLTDGDGLSLLPQLRGAFSLVLVAQLARALFPQRADAAVLAPWIVSVLFERGAFGAEDTVRVAEVLRFGALQIPFYILGIVTARVVVSLQESKLMLTMSLGALLANAGLNWLLMLAGCAAGLASLWLLILYALKGTAGPNRYGPDPLDGSGV